MRTLNHNIKPYFFLALFILLVIVICFLTSCSTAKRLERKKESAVNTVLADVNLLNRVGEKYRELEPCIPSQPVTTKRDTTTITNTVTKILPGKVDTLLNTRTDTLVIEHTKTVTIRDTVKVKDLERENRLIDSLTRYKLLVAKYEGQTLELANQLNKETKRGDKWFWWFIGAIAALLGSNGLWLYIKFKNPIIKMK
jgi:hypothetical protein